QRNSHTRGDSAASSNRREEQGTARIEPWFKVERVHQPVISKHRRDSKWKAGQDETAMLSPRRIRFPNGDAIGVGGPGEATAFEPLRLCETRLSPCRPPKVVRIDCEQEDGETEGRHARQPRLSPSVLKGMACTFKTEA